MPATHNSQLPLQGDLPEEVEHTGQPATTPDCEAPHGFVTERRKKQQLHEEIAAFAADHAATGLDLDRELEQAGIEAIEGAVDK